MKKKAVKQILLILLLSFMVALPVTYFTLDNSINNAQMIYGYVAKTMHLQNPNVINLDSDGVPFVDYGYKNGKWIGVQRNPLTISYYANNYYEEYIESNDEKKLKLFLNSISFLENIEEYKAYDNILFIVYPYNFSVNDKHGEAPLYSAMAQSFISISFLNAYKMTGNDKYLEKSELAMNALKVPIEEGGVLYIEPEDGGYWYAEVACAKKLNNIPLILNGNIFSLLDLHKYYEETGSEDARILFEKGVDEVKIHLHKYDAEYWTYYDRQGNWAYDYHYVHVEQMKELYEITGDPIFEKYYKKWKSYTPFNPLWARKRFAAYVLNVFLIFLLGGGLAIVINKLKRGLEK